MVDLWVRGTLEIMRRKRLIYFAGLLPNEWAKYKKISHLTFSFTEVREALWKIFPWKAGTDDSDIMAETIIAWHAKHFKKT